MARSFFNYAKRSFLFIFGGIWLLVGIPFLGVGIGNALSEQRFQRQGMVATGTVLSKDLRRATKNRSTRYSVRFRFTTANGQTLTDDAQVPFEQWEQLQEQGPIQVTYLPTRPESNRLAGKDPFLSVIFGGLGLVFAGIGGFLFFKAISGILRNMHLERDGALATGTVTSVEQTNLKVNGRPLWRIRYQFTDRQGRKVDGKSEAMPWEEVARLGEGASGKVRFDPAKPTSNLWMG